MTRLITLEEVKERKDFAKLCNRLNLVKALEIGVDRAEFAIEFLKEWKGHTWVGVDPYLPYEGMPWNREADFMMAVNRLCPFSPVSRLIRCTSEEFAQAIRQPNHETTFPNFEPDFCYIDGRHDAASVTNDIEVWWNLLCKHGVLAGHDYGEHHPGVLLAVDRFANRHNLPIYLTQDFPKSWYIFKGQS